FAALGRLACLSAVEGPLMVVAKRKEPLLLQGQCAWEKGQPGLYILKPTLQRHVGATTVALKFGQVRLRAAQQTSEDRGRSGRRGAKEAIDDRGFDAGYGLALHLFKHGEQAAAQVGWVDVGRI